MADWEGVQVEKCDLTLGRSGQRFDAFSKVLVATHGKTSM
jgi:hypothetical protein